MDSSNRRFDGTAARQLTLEDEAHVPLVAPQRSVRPPLGLRLLQKDVYADLARRRRRAQIMARHVLEGRGEGRES